MVSDFRLFNRAIRMSQAPEKVPVAAIGSLRLRFVSRQRVIGYVEAAARGESSTLVSVVPAESRNPGAFRTKTRKRTWMPGGSLS